MCKKHKCRGRMDARMSDEDVVLDKANTLNVINNLWCREEDLNLSWIMLQGVDCCISFDVYCLPMFHGCAIIAEV